MKPPAWIRSPNFQKGRSGRKPDVLVIHVMEGTLAGTDSWFRTKKSGVSAHYGIGLNRAVHQYVDESDQAWHAGRVLRPTARLIKERPAVNPNIFTIGVEHEGTATSVWPDTMYADSAELVAAIAERWGIPLDRDHVIGHREIFAGKTCPGAGDVDRIVATAQEILRGSAPEHRAAAIVLKQGDRGPLTERLQTLLVEAGYMTQAQMDTGPGIHGPQTAAAFRAFLAAHS